MDIALFYASQHCLAVLFASSNCRWVPLNATGAKGVKGCLGARGKGHGTAHSEDGTEEKRGYVPQLEVLEHDAER
jgi:hypothetical protein